MQPYWLKPKEYVKIVTIMDNRIKQLRLENGYSIRSLAEALTESGFKITSMTISRYERGEREPKISTWEKLATFFNVSTSYIQGLTDVRRTNYSLDDVNNGTINLDEFNQQYDQGVLETYSKKLETFENLFPELGNFEKLNTNQRADIYISLKNLFFSQAILYNHSEKVLDQKLQSAFVDSLQGILLASERILEPLIIANTKEHATPEDDNMNEKDRNNVYTLFGGYLELVQKLVDLKHSK
ncbi:helix-turn-helix domain-containing protein [Leuconostoc lactis]|uniref:helix-turn-helix domain-containing protein n=1 Tax=Leuconostoc lactis TaxID=1246 RepID=UPI00289E4B2A|nr:helix-turn-helix transcriptional regulator [Leuconostoc lactis]